jgi:hypothetical protein
MNRYHRRCCRSPGWSAFMAGTVLPHALDGIDLGPRALELGPGYGADEGLVRFAAYTPRAEGEARPGAAA